MMHQTRWVFPLPWRKCPRHQTTSRAGVEPRGLGVKFAHYEQARHREPEADDADGNEAVEHDGKTSSNTAVLK